MSTKRKLLLIIFIVASVASMFARFYYQRSERRRMEQTLDSLARYEREHPIAPPGVVAATPDTEEKVEETRDMFASELPRESLDAIRGAVGGDFKLMELRFADELVSAVVSTDGESAHQYVLYRGKKTVEGPNTINLVGDNKLTDSLYELKQADLSLMPKLAKDALQRAELEGAKVTSMSFSYPIIRYKGETPEWTVFVERGSPPDWDHKFVTFDAKGKFKSIS